MEKLKSFFRFTSRERLAILLLYLLMVLFWTLPLFFPEKPPKISMPSSQASHFNVSSSNGFAYGDALPASNAPVSGISRPANSNFSNATTKRVAHYFPFNPNTISPQQWQELGLRDKTILTIQHYLEKGGRFRKPNDLRKIWGLKQLKQICLFLMFKFQHPSPKAKRKNWFGKQPQNMIVSS